MPKCRSGLTAADSAGSAGMMGLLWTVLWLLVIITAVGGVTVLIYFRVAAYRAIYRRPGDFYERGDDEQP